MDKIPDSVILDIFSYLTTGELLNCAAVVSKRWRRISFDKSLWKVLAVNDLAVPNQSVKDEHVKILLNRGKNLKEFSFENCIELSNRCLLDLSFNTSKLQYLNVEGCGRISDRGVLRLAKHCNSLKVVNLHGTRVTDKGLCELIAANLKLTNLKASSLMMTENTIQVLAGHCKNLESLHVERYSFYTPILTNDMIMLLAIHCPQLVTLILRYVKVQLCDSVMAFLGHSCRKLKTVEIGELDHNALMSDQGIVNFCLPLKELESLELKETDITDISLHALAMSCHNLRRLNLKHCRQVSDIGLMNLLKHCCQLESLDLGSGYNGKVTNIGALALSQSPCVKNLKNLSLYLWDIDDFGFYVLSCNAFQLQSLSIEGCIRVTYHGLKESLSVLKDLKTLDISFTECVKNDCDLNALSGLFAQLDELTIIGLKGVTVKGVNTLLATLPDCDVTTNLIISS